MKSHEMYMKWDDDDGGIQKTGQEEMRKVKRKQNRKTEKIRDRVGK